MKPSTFITTAMLAIGLASCSTGDSPLLQQARSMQESMMRNCQSLDSTVSIKITELEAKLIEMSQDTSLNGDSIKLGSYVAIKEKYNSLLDYKTKIDNWRLGVKLIPTPEEIANGAENPFGKDAKDEDVLTQIKSANADYLTMQADIASMMK
jgi:hypothetical protein